jgi:hypothetical protein
VIQYRSPQRPQAGLAGVLAMAMLLLPGLVQGADAEGATAPQGEPPVTPAPAPPQAAAPADAPPPARTPEAPPRRFIPTEQVSEDRAVAFPKDI